MTNIGISFLFFYLRKMKKALVLLSVYMLGACTVNTEDQINDLISQMTLEEKVSMLHGQTMFSSGGVERLGIAPMKYADGPFGVREELEPHSWAPIGWTTDSATFFPTGSALAATWSEDMAYKYGKTLAAEARTRGKDMILGPAINIQRIPTGGRTYEYLSEDPFLSARLAVGYVRGVQENGAAACVKHYALNNQENSRGIVDVIVSERAMREIYLEPFRAAVMEGGALGVMAAYNKVGGQWCSENNLLQNRILRDEWGFRGMIVSDWGGTHSTVDAAMNGLDVEMPMGWFFGKALLDSAQQGVVPVEVIDKKIRNILRVRMAVKPIPEAEANIAPVNTPENSAAVYEIATKSIVLLKNKGEILPLDPVKYGKIAVIGENAVSANALGGIGAGVKARYEVTPLEGLKNRIADKAEIVYARGYKGYTRQDRERGGVLGGVVLTGTGGMLGGEGILGAGLDSVLLAEALEAARWANVVLFFAGNNREVETEGADRTNIFLPSMQDELIKAVAAVNPNIVTIVVAGAPVDLTTVEACSPAMLVSWFNGSESGNALADILLGSVSPSGRLPFTFPVRLEDSPAYALECYPASERAEYKEGFYVGYRWFDRQQIRPLYAFGHGLSYTRFEYSGIKTGKDAYSADEKIDVSFVLANTGDRTAEEVVQLYIKRTGNSIEFPVKELKAFKRVALNPGEKKPVKLTVPVSSLQYWDEATHAWKLESGVIELCIGSSSDNLSLSKSVAVYL